MSKCSICGDVICRQINHKGIYWYCPSCHQEVPNFSLINSSKLVKTRYRTSNSSSVRLLDPLKQKYHSSSIVAEVPMRLPSQPESVNFERVPFLEQVSSSSVATFPKQPEILAEASRLTLLERYKQEVNRLISQNEWEKILSFDNYSNSVNSAK
ncbi:MAG: hypothetical protein ACFBSE_08005 [Prochloraceae cyanobacterium]